MNYAFLDVTYRQDTSSTLPIDTNQYDYYSAGISLVLSDMVSLPSSIDFMKLRASYAEVGNDTDPYKLSRLANLQNGGFIALDGTAPASNLKPEMTKTFEIGLDATLFNRVNLDLTYYKSNSLDQLFAQDVPQGSGVSAKFINGADIENSGIEAFINVGLLTKGDFLWDVSFNYAANDSKVLELLKGINTIELWYDFMRSFRLDVGMPYGVVCTLEVLKEMLREEF